MTRQAPDPALAAAARDELVAMTERRAWAAARPDRPRWLLQGVVAAILLVLVVGGTLVALRAAAARNGVAATPTGSPIPSPTRVHCAGGRTDAFLPFGCGRWDSVDGHDANGEIAWLRTDPMFVLFGSQDQSPWIGVNAPCGGFGATLVLTTSVLSVDSTRASVSAAACAGTQRGWSTARLIALFARPVAYSVTDDRLTLTSGSTVVHLRREETATAAATPTRVHCAGSVGDSWAPFGCGVFRAVDGRDARGPIPWLPGSRVGLQTSWQGSTPAASISGVCDSSGDVHLAVHPDRIVLDAHDGWSPLPVCSATAAAHDRAVFDFFDGSVAFSLQGDDLTVARGDVVIRFRRVPAP